MDQSIYQEYLKAYALEALEAGNDDVSAAADFLEKKSRASLLAKDRKEKRAALSRARKVFNETRDRSAYMALKSLGFDELAKSKL